MKIKQVRGAERSAFERLTITLPRSFARTIDRIAVAEYGSRSSIIRHAVRIFLKVYENDEVVDVDTLKILRARTRDRKQFVVYERTK